MRVATLPALPTGYRNAAVGASTRAELGQWLRTASDALTLAVITVEGRSGDDRGDKLRRAEQARSFLVEATRALGRARRTAEERVERRRSHRQAMAVAEEALVEPE